MRVSVSERRFVVQEAFARLVAAEQASEQQRVVGGRSRGRRLERGIRFAGPTAVGYGLRMSTLAEIEQAAEVLPVEQKQRLVAFLLAGLRKEGAPLPPPRDIPKATIEQWVAEDEEGFRKFKAGV
ncbi:MAG: hypothetical protein FGM15_13345 [Chthoniobacterales bacterium]|nr:hypothetical protein [Chthoniobacterales bacterium]